MDDKEYFEAMLGLQARSHQVALLSATWVGDDFVIIVDNKTSIPEMRERLGRIVQADRRMNVSQLFANVVIKTQE